MLAFPDLKPADFRPWFDPADATRAGLTPEEYSAKMANVWRNGLSEWVQSPERIAKFRMRLIFRSIPRRAMSGCR